MTDRNRSADPGYDTRDEKRLDPTARPRLRPEAVLLSRGDAEFQIGVDGGVSLLVPDRERRLQTVLRGLDGSRTWATVRADAATFAVTAAELTRLLQRLAAAGLAELDGTPGARETSLGHVRLVGVGPLGAAIGELLLRSGFRLYVVDDSPATGRAEVFRDRCRSEGLGDWTRGEPVQVRGHWTKPEARTIRLTVIAASGLEPDRVPPADLLRRDAPHLLVRPQAGGAVVGPLVVPGESSCLHCADLTRRDVDPAWPGLLRQLGLRTVPLPAAAVAWAAGVTATQVMNFLAGGRPETFGATLELSAPAYAMAWRRWPPHPDCGCHWNGHWNGPVRHTSRAG